MIPPDTSLRERGGNHETGRSPVEKNGRQVSQKFLTVSHLDSAIDAPQPLVCFCGGRAGKSKQLKSNKISKLLATHINWVLFTL